MLREVRLLFYYISEKFVATRGVVTLVEQRRFKFRCQPTMDPHVLLHKNAKRIDYQHTEILSSVFSSHFSERLLVKRASYFGRESARCLR